MNTAELDDFMTFNDQLSALIEAGVSIDVGLDSAGRALPQALEAINAIVARRMSHGDSLEDALQDDNVPAWYRYIVVSGLRGRDMHTTLSAMSRVANTADESRYVAESAFFYPLVICVLAYLGLIGFCWFVVPPLERTYEDMQIQPGTGLAVLLLMRDTLPYWVAIPPILLVLIIAWRYVPGWRPVLLARPRRSLLAWLSGLSRAMYEQRSAYFAESLASLVDNAMPIEKALPVAAGAYCDPDLAAGARALSTTISSDRPAGIGSAAAIRFPPFLRWALLQSESTVGRGRALRMAAALYRQSAARRIERSRIIAPIIVLVILGGGVTLMYSLAVFVPVIQMLRALSEAPT